MKWTKMLVSIFCLSCLLTTGYIAEGSSQVSITVPNLLTELPYNWRPEDGASLCFNVEVTMPAYYSGKLTATLSEVTNYPGACGNRDSFYNDLELRQDSFHNSGWRVETEKVELSHTIENDVSDTNTERIPLRVDCADYAAYGILKFTVTGSSSSITIKIPRDTNGNKIADCWKDDETTADPNNNNPSKNYVASWDEESGPPNNSQRGDNLTVLDEYRGLYVNGSWTDTDPEGWDVFIRSESGLGYATSLPGMTPHLMGLGEVSHDLGHVLYYQASSSFPGRVYAIRLKNDNVGFDRENPQDSLGHMGLGPPSAGTKGMKLGTVFICIIARIIPTWIATCGKTLMLRRST